MSVYPSCVLLLPEHMAHDVRISRRMVTIKHASADDASAESAFLVACAFALEEEATGEHGYRAFGAPRP